MSVPLPAKVGRETCKVIVLLLFFIKQQYDGHKSSKVRLLRKIQSNKSSKVHLLPKTKSDHGMLLSLKTMVMFP